MDVAQNPGRGKMSKIFGFDDAGIAAMSKQDQYLNEAQAFRMLKSVRTRHRLSIEVLFSSTRQESTISMPGLVCCVRSR